MYTIRKEVISYENAQFNTISDVVAYKVKHFRKKQKLTQEQLSKKLELSRASVSNIEKARHNITLEMLEKLCQVFGVNSNEILPF